MIFAHILRFLSFVALIALVRGDGATCQTSTGSPWASDCKNALSSIKDGIGRLGNEDCELPNGVLNSWFLPFALHTLKIKSTKSSACVLIRNPNLGIKSKCRTVKKSGSCKVDLCFTGGTGDGSVRKDHIVDIGNKLLSESNCGRYAMDGKTAGLKIGGYYTIDNPRESFKDDPWCKAPKQSMKVQFSKG
ncbi:hypothetical protein F4776DRAFT_669841 [Hypoxylon sp. NC0597]|nr:hypothetical protein F4776DRAFT_669841 [Hypoxylon sp. NC0597]